MKNTLHALLSPDVKTRLYSHLKCNLKSEFWKDYEFNKNFILKNCKRLLDEDKVSLAKEGALERYMLKFLIYNDPDYQQIKDTYSDVIIETYPLYFAFGFVQNDRNEVVQISQAIQRFHKSKRPFVLTLFLGVVNHWTALIFYKYDAAKPPIATFLDSCDINILNKDDITLAEVLDRVDDKYRRFIGKQPEIPFYKKYFKHCVYDTRMLLRNLEDIVLENTEQLHTLAWRRITFNVLKSFESTLAFIVDSENRFLENIKNLDRKSSTETDENLNRTSFSDEFRTRLYALDNGEYKEQLKEFFFPISDPVGDYSNILSIEPDSGLVGILIENLEFWMYEYHPTHIYKCIYGPMEHYGSTCINRKDEKLLLNWLDTIDHIVNISGVLNF